MKLNIVSLDTFKISVKKLYKKYRNLLNDLKSLNKILQENPKAGIALGQNCYKIRLANSSIPTGKSGGFRVIYYYFDNQNNLYLMIIYSKTELDNISDKKLNEILQMNKLLIK